MATYSIIRFHADKPNKVIKTGVTLAEAQEHCNDDSTKGFNWFDGYTEEQD